MVFNTATKPGLDDEESNGSEKEDYNGKYSDLTQKGKYKRSKNALPGTPRSIYCGESFGGCIKLAAIFTIKVGRVQAATTLQSNELTIKINNHAETTMLG